MLDDREVLSRCWRGKRKAGGNGVKTYIAHSVLVKKIVTTVDEAMGGSPGE
jgi:hypothetical protein